MIQVDIRESSVETTERLPHVWNRAKQVENGFSEVFGISVNLIDKLRPTDARGNTPRNIPEKCLVTPDASEKWLHEVRNGASHWRISDIDAYFGKSRGSENVTYTVVDEDLSFGETFALLAKNGHLETSVEQFETICSPSDPDPIWSVAYQILILSLGWDAERILDQLTDFSKSSAGHDGGGIDGHGKGSWKDKLMQEHGHNRLQVKPVTRAGSYGSGNMKGEEITRLVYTWDHQGHLIATFDGYADLKNAVAEQFGMAGKSAPNGQQSSRFWKSWEGTTTGLNRAARYLAIHPDHAVDEDGKA
jgi:hypothetical protein